MIFKSIQGMVAVFAGMALGYLFHFFMVRNVSPDIYGDISLIIGILAILLVPTGSIQTILTREVAKLGDEKRILEFLKNYAKKIVAYSIPTAVVLFFSSYAISWIFSDSALIIPLQIISLTVPFAYLLSVMMSYLRGKEKIGSLGIIMVTEPAIKLISAVILVYAGFGLIGASASLALSYVLPAIVLALIFIKRTNASIKKHVSLRPFMYVLATNIILMIFLYIDLFAVKYYLGSENTGFYNVANVTAKVLMYAVGGINMIILPKASKINGDSKKIRSLITKSILLTLPVFLVFAAFPKELISLFYTAKYLPALEAFRILTIGMFAYAVFTIFLNISWSQNKEKYPLMLSFIILAADAVLLAYLVPAYGLAGASAATTLSSIALLIGICSSNVVKK